jgi:hypothetical protein
MKCYRCGADYWDHAWFREDRRGRVTEIVQCAFCGALESQACDARAATRAVAVLEGGDGFVFDSGRFAGKSISEVAAHPSGANYLLWAMKNVPHWSLAIKEYLDHAAPSA